METSDNQINWDKLLDALEGAETPPLTAEEEALLQETRSMAEMVAMRKKFPGAAGWQQFMAARDSRHTKVVWWTPLKKIAAAAAVLLLLIAGGLWLSTTSDKIVPKQISKADLPPKGKPFLNLSNGKQLVLDGNTQSVNNNGTTVKASDSAISYAGATADIAADANDTLVVPRGFKIRMMLADGTRVWVNAESQLVYPAAFKGGTREVTVKGEAYFDVAQNSQQPFIVHVGNMDVKVLGTAFNINAYEEDQLQTTLTSGKVIVSAGAKQQVLSPGEQVTYGDGMMYKSAVTAYIYTAWKDDELYFDDAPLLDITTQLGRSYDYEFIYTDRSLEKLSFTLEMQQPANLQQVLDRIHRTNGQINFKVQERTVTISR